MSAMPISVNAVRRFMIVLPLLKFCICNECVAVEPNPAQTQNLSSKSMDCIIRTDDPEPVSSSIVGRLTLSALNGNWQRRWVGVAAAGQGFVRAKIFAA